MINKPDTWIDDLIANSQSVEPTGKIEQELINLLVTYCYTNKNIADGNIGLLLASAFDLIVAIQYYSRLLHNGWLYCPHDEPRIFFHYTNCCPRCAIRNDFKFHKSKKPQSGVIGTATAKILLLFFKQLFEYHGLEEQVLKGREPVDAIILNRSKNKVLFAEIKASPLMTPSITMRSQKIMEDIDGESVPSEHIDISNTGLFNSDLEILIPKYVDGSWRDNYFPIGTRKDGMEDIDGESVPSEHIDISNTGLFNSDLEILIPKYVDGSWRDNYFPIGTRKDGNDKEWGYRGIINLINNYDQFYPDYFNFWKHSLSKYFPKKTDSIYWLTNACGAPRPMPDDWEKRRSGSGYESISDSKTSVGMDRTDDIKKGTYQVLKLGADGKKINSRWSYKVGIISNIHAARHFEQYLESIKDVVWTLDITGEAKVASDLPEDQELYNLFDCIVALTKAISRDRWLTNLFAILE